TTCTSSSAMSWPTASASCSGSTGPAATTRVFMSGRYPEAAARKRPSGPLAGMALAWPGRQQEEQPEAGRGANPDARGGLEHGQRAGAGALGAAVLDQLDLAVHDDQPRPLVDLVLLQHLAGRERDDDRAALALGLEHLGLVGGHVERAQVPVAHGGHPTL